MFRKDAGKNGAINPDTTMFEIPYAMIEAKKSIKIDLNRLPLKKGL